MGINPFTRTPKTRTERCSTERCCHKFSNLYNRAISNMYNNRIADGAE